MATREAKPAGSQDIWHLDIEDLLGRPAEAERAHGPGPFVITLRTSSTPITVVPKALPAFEPLHVYQLRRHEGTQAQFRLCIGIIDTELEADAILARVRELYPRARREPAQDDDRAAVARKMTAAAAHAAPVSTAPSKPAMTLPDPKPPEPFRWNIDEVLPSLATETPERIRRQPMKLPEPAARPERKSPPTVPPRVVTESPPTVPSRVVTEPPPKVPSRVVAEPPPTVPAQVVAEPPPIVPARVVAEPPPTVPARVVAEPPPTVPARVVAESPPRAEPIESDPNAVTDEFETLQFTFDDSMFEESEVEVSGIEFVEIDPPVAQSALETETTPAAATPVADGAEAIEPRDIDKIIEAVVIEPTEPALTLAEQHVAEEPDEEAPHALAPPLGVPDAASSLSLVEEPASPPPVPSAGRSSTSDSGTLETLVAKIGALVESVEATEEPERTEWPVTGSADLPTIDSTQTIRALTAPELSDDHASRWFAIQLVQSERPIDPGEVPNLGIFAEYRLYSVAGLEEDRVVHTLRLGFFSSESAADAVARYLAPFFAAPCVKRVSGAEQVRFEERRVAARKDVGELGAHAVIELTAPAALPERQASTKPQEGDETNGGETTSLWSRLLAARKR